LSEETLDGLKLTNSLFGFVSNESELENDSKQEATFMTETEYRQSAVYRLFDVKCKLGGLMHHAVNANAYSKIKGALKELNTLSPADFAEDEDGNLIKDLLPLGRPVWIDRD